MGEKIIKNPHLMLNRDITLIHALSVNDKELKYDIREWVPEHAKMARGVRLSKNEVMRLKMS